MNWPKLKLPWSVSFASFINALSIPVIAVLLWWVLDRTLDPTGWCPAAEELKLQSQVAQAKVAALSTPLCQPIILAQLVIAKYVAVGLVAALSLSHLVSVVREAKAGLDIQTKFGNVKIGGDNATEGAKFVAQKADEAAEQVEAAEPKPVTTPGELP